MSSDEKMILNDVELQATQERIKWFCDVLAQLRVADVQSDFRYMASGYLSELEKMQAEVRAYLGYHVNESFPQDAA